MVDGEYSRTWSINLAKGRVTAYDNHEVTSDDSLEILNYLTELVEFSYLQLYLADYNSDGTVDIGDVIAINNHLNGTNSYSLTDEVEGWGCSLAEMIELKTGKSIEVYVAENYDTLNELHVIPDAIRSDLHAS